MRNAAHAKGVHVGKRRRPGGVDSHREIHSAAHRFDRFLGLVTDADNLHALSGVFVLQIRQSREAQPPRGMPADPEADDINKILLRRKVHRTALDPFGNRQLRRRHAQLASAANPGMGHDKSQRPRSQKAGKAVCEGRFHNDYGRKSSAVSIGRQWRSIMFFIGRSSNSPPWSCALPANFTFISSYPNGIPPSSPGLVSRASGLPTLGWMPFADSTPTGLRPICRNGRNTFGVEFVFR